MAKNSEFFADLAVTEMFVEFLRAISACDTSGRVLSISASYWRALKFLAEMEGDQRIRCLDQTIASILDAARDPDPSRDLDRVAQQAAKVLAEKISGVATQHTRAESALADAILRMDTYRRRYP